jgi:hypothetical protein
LAGGSEASDRFPEKSGLRLGHQLLDSGETLGGIVAFHCHVEPCLSWERKSIANGTTIPVFCFAQCEDKAVKSREERVVGLWSDTCL